MTIIGRFKNAWKAFHNRSPTSEELAKDPPKPVISTASGTYSNGGYTLRYENAQTILASIYSRLAIDTSNFEIRHAMVNPDSEAFQSMIHSTFNIIFGPRANVDQTGRHLIRDAVLTMFDRGHAVLVPTECSTDPLKTTDFEILEMRVGYVTEWFVDHVAVELYDSTTGAYNELTLPKSVVAIIENPMGVVMNGPNGTLTRLKHKLALLDQLDRNVSSDKFNLLLQYPYPLQTEQQKLEAQERITTLENQMETSKYGIGYIGVSESVIQLNRSADNNLLEQIDKLTGQLLSTLGLSEAVFNGTADEQTLLNYHSNTLEVFLKAIVEGMMKSFISLHSYKKGERFIYIFDRFKLATASDLANMANSLIRNEVTTSNEFRRYIPYLPPSDDPRANQLRNPNMAAEKDGLVNVSEGGNQNGKEIQDP